MQQIAEVKILANTPLGPRDKGIFCLELELPPWGEWRPGQFLMVRERRADTSLTWARPFCISHADKERLTVYFQVIGRATREMAKLQAGGRLDVWGPLGNSLAVEEDAPTLLLAGGMGISPLLGYALRHPCPENLELLFGHRLPLACYPFDKLPPGVKASSHPETCLDDRDCFLSLIEERVRAIAATGLVLACGPLPFLRVIQGIAGKYGARAQISLETRMACGIGACLGCVVKVSYKPGQPGRFAQTCTCGPNFWADKVEV